MNPATQVTHSDQTHSLGNTRGKQSLLKRITAKAWELLKEKDSPHKIALGLALGIFIGFLPIMGIQMAVVTVLALPLKGNLKAAIAGVWVSNPVTFIPLYWVNYLLGTVFYHGNAVSWQEFGGHMTRTAGWDWTAVKASLQSILYLGADVFAPLWLGSAILAVVFGVVTYFVTLRWVVFYRSRDAALEAAPDAAAPSQIKAA